jgi:hypothetical protein
VSAARRQVSGLDVTASARTESPEVEGAGLKSLNVPANEDLGAFINRLYEGPYGSKLSLRGSLVGTSMAASTLSDPRGAAVESAAVLGGSVSLAAPSQMMDQMPAVALPLYHSIKISLLGPMCSGKETAIKALKENLGDNLTVFKINDVIREALTYVHPDS